jgi:hypothetical protein
VTGDDEAGASRLPLGARTSAPGSQTAWHRASSFLAKAIDEHKDLLETGYEHFAYDPAQVWQAYGVPLAPGAERYYFEKGYMAPRPHGNLPFGTNP